MGEQAGLRGTLERVLVKHGLRVAETSTGRVRTMVEKCMVGSLVERMTRKRVCINRFRMSGGWELKDEKGLVVCICIC